MRSVRNSKSKRTTRSLSARRSAVVAVIDVLEKRQMLSTTIANWTFSSNNYNTSAPVAAATASATEKANSGSGGFFGYHAGASTYASPFGNGQNYSIGSTNWQPNTDYYQFNVSTSGYTAITLSFDQTSSPDGPGQFQLQYQVGSGAYTPIGGTYTVLENGGSPNAPWNSIATTNNLDPGNPVYTESFDVSATAGNSNVNFRLVDASTVAANSSVGTVASTGSDRVDNIFVIGSNAPTFNSSSTIANAITNTAATLNASVNSSTGNVSSYAITSEGFVYSLTSQNSNPLLGGSNVTAVQNAVPAIGSYFLNATGLSSSQSYSFKAYANYSNGVSTTTSYSNIGTFTTLASAATVPSVTNPVESNGTGATPINLGVTLTATLAANGSSPVLSEGFVYALNSSNSNPTLGGAGVTAVNVSSSSLVAPGNNFNFLVKTLPQAGSYAWVGYANNAQGTYYTPVQTFTFSDPITTNISTVESLGNTSTGAVTISNSSNPLLVTHILSIPGNIQSQNFAGYNFLLQDNSGTAGAAESIEVTGYVPGTGGYIPAVGDTISQISGFYNNVNLFPVLQNITSITKAGSGASVPAVPTLTLAAANVSGTSYLTSSFKGFLVTLQDVSLGGNTQSSPTYLNSFGTFGSITTIPETLTDSSGNSINFYYAPSNNYYTLSNLLNQNAYPSTGVDITGIIDYSSGRTEIQPITMTPGTSPIVADNTVAQDTFTCSNNYSTGQTAFDVTNGGYINYPGSSTTYASVKVTWNSTDGYNSPVSFNYTTANGTGVAGVDFGTPGVSNQVSGTVTFSGSTSGNNTAYINIPILKRYSPSGPHNFRINFSRPTSGYSGRLFSAPGYVVTVVDTTPLNATAAQFDALPSGTANVTVGNNSPLIITSVLSQPTTVDGLSYSNWSFFAQDGTGAGFDVFGLLPGGFTPLAGEQISITGTISPYHWIPEMANVTSVNVLSYGNAIPAIPKLTIPQAVTAGTSPTSYPQGDPTVLGHLVELDNVYISGAAGAFANQNIQATISDGANGTGNPLEFYYWPTSYSAALSYFYGTTIPGPTQAVNLIGFVSNYNNSPYGVEFSPIAYAGGVAFDQFSYVSDANPPVATDWDKFPNVARGAAIHVTITRNNGTDAATIPWSLLPDSGVAGVDYYGVTSMNSSGTVTNYSNATAQLSGILYFAPGVTADTLTIQTVPNPGDHGDKLFTVLLGASTGNGAPEEYSNYSTNTIDSNLVPSVFLTGPTTIQINDPNGANIQSNSAYGDNYTIQPGGVYQVATPADYGTTRVGVSGSATGNSSYALVSYNDPNTDATHYFPNTTFSTIDGIEFETWANSLSTDHSGYLNVYLVTKNLSSLTRGGNTPYFSGGGTGLLTSQVGSSYLLGTFYFNKNQQASQYVPANLTNLDPTALQMLVSDLANGTTFSLAITPGTVLAPETGQTVGQIDTGVSATFVGSDNSAHMPILRVNYETNLPSNYAWLSNGSSGLIYSYPTNTLVVEGSASIVSNPGSGAPTLAIIDAGTLTINPSTVSLNGLSLGNGSSAAFNSTSGNLLLLGSGGLSIDSTSRFNIADNYINIQNGAGSLSTIQSEITSGLLYSSDTSLGYLGTVAAIANNQLGTTTPVRTSFGGSAAGSGDLLIRYTYYGDANLDGTVNSVDYGFIDNGWLSEQSTSTNVSGWGNGDFNYDGIVNGSDYTLIDNAFNMQGNPLATASAQIAAVSATPAALVGSSSSTDSFFSDKKVKPSIISDLEDLVTGD